MDATLFELEDFLSNKKKSVTSVSWYWNPKPSPLEKPVPIMNLKISHKKIKKTARTVTPYDDSRTDSFEPQPNKHRQEATDEAVSKFATKF